VREKGGEGTSSQEALYRYFSARKVSAKASAPSAPETVKAALPDEAPVEETPVKAAPPEAVPVKSEPVAAPTAPVIAPVKALEPTPPPEPVGLLRKLRSLSSWRRHS